MKLVGSANWAATLSPTQSKYIYNEIVRYYAHLHTQKVDKLLHRNYND